MIDSATDSSENRNSTPNIFSARRRLRLISAAQSARMIAPIAKPHTLLVPSVAPHRRNVLLWVATPSEVKAGEKPNGASR